MLRYLIKRMLLIIPTLIGVSIVTFFLTRILPGGPVEQAIMHMTQGKDRSLRKEVNSEEIARLNKIYGFDKPVVQQYFMWMGKIVRGDFGESFRSFRPVTQVIFSRVPISLTFGLTGFFLSYLICIPLGIKKALKHKQLYDSITSAIVYIGYSIPGFALGVLLLVFLGGGTFLNLFPLRGIVSDNFEYLPWYGKIFDFIHHMILPVFCYTVGGFAVLTTLMKNSLLDELGKDYIRTAMAKGLPFRKVVYRHALRNAFIPILTGLGSFFSIFFAGSILIEKVFTIPGMGLLSYDSMLNRDYPVVLGLILIQTLFALLGRLVSDFSLAAADPRISFE
ncbi:MAG: ABC transporter permease subunit [Spirochaetales bacterium]|nr:ABC transporter permease subunit [Spirochaetales bacterium]